MEAYAERNHYADHLVEINRYNPVITTEDVKNTLGATIILKGTPITEDVANKLAKFQLLKPLELQVNLVDTILPSQIFNDLRGSQLMKKLFTSHPKLAKEMVRQCGLVQSYPLLAQKITVFEERLSKYYTEAQSVSGFALLIGLQMGLEDERLENIFLAAQMREAGLLNIAPEQCADKANLPTNERRAIDQLHLSLGKEFLDQVPNLSKRVGTAVLENGELMDGSGWPSASLSDEATAANNTESQILGLAVMLEAAYERKLRTRGYGFGDLLPHLQVEGNAISPTVYSAAVDALKTYCGERSCSLPQEFVPAMARYLSVLQRFLIHWVELAKEFTAELPSSAQDDMIERPHRILLSLEEIFRNSGIWDPLLLDWLRNVETHVTSEEQAETEVVSLMFETVIGKLKRFQWSLNEAAKSLGEEKLMRCDELSTMLFSLADDHFDALQRYRCFDD